MIVAGGVGAQVVYPTTMKVPVTYFDYHSDGSNPDFNPGLHDGRKHLNLVATTLDADGLPTRGDSIFFSYEVGKWFRPWVAGAPGNLEKPVYNKPAGTLIGTPTNAGPDALYSNVVFDKTDSLTFTLVPLSNGVYEFDDQEFWPLDNRAGSFGNEPSVGPAGTGSYNLHNYGFTMMLRWTFTYQPGLVFNFRGDDDVWVFIDSTLVMDLGGIHSPENGVLLVDNIAPGLGLVLGSTYSFDLFYCERQATGSSIRITSNIIRPHQVSKVTIDAVPASSTIMAGDFVHFTGTVWYDTTVRKGNGTGDSIYQKKDTTLSKKLTWVYSVVDPYSTLTNPIGDTTSFTSTAAYMTYNLTATYTDPSGDKFATMTVHVIPALADHLVIEASADTSTLAKKQHNQPLDTLSIGPVAQSGNAYGILRDRYGNFVTYSQHTAWNIILGTFINGIANGNTAIGERIISRNVIAGLGRVNAADLDSTGLKFVDSMFVKVLNAAPVAANDIYSTSEDIPLSVNVATGVLANDADNPGNTLTASILAQPATGGSVVLNADGSFIYTPTANFNGSVSFTYRAFDTELYSTATVTIVVNPVNDIPAAIPDVYTVNEDAALSVSAPGVLINDSDADGTSLTAYVVDPPIQPGHTITMAANGSFTYTRPLNFNGQITFTYGVTDGSANSAKVTDTITVTPVNDAPTAGNDAYNISEGVALNVPSAGNPNVLANDVDIDGDALKTELVTGILPAQGSLVFRDDGSFTYTPAAFLNGTVTFTYRVKDAALYSAPATVNIFIGSVNDPPVAVREKYTIQEDGILTVSAPGLLSNDTDPENDPLKVVPVGTLPAGLTLNQNGSLSYTPVLNFNGIVAFTYQANDGFLNSNIVTDTIAVTAVNDKPIVAANVTYNATEDVVLTIAANGVPPGLLSYVTDVDNTNLTVKMITSVLPAQGTLTVQSDGAFVYTPTLNYFGTATFTFRAYDLTDSSAIATATIVVAPVNDAPIAGADSFTVNEDAVLTVTSPNILTNDSDVDLVIPLKAVLVTNVKNGTLTPITNGSFTYTPNPNFFGKDSFSYVANDGSLSSPEVLVKITVNSINDVPVARDTAYTINEDDSLVVTAPGLLKLVTDNDGNPLTISQYSAASSGTVTGNTNGSFVYKPLANFHGTATFTYRANDGTVNSNLATVTITVNTVNDAPNATPDIYNTGEDTTLIVAAAGVLSNDSDNDGDPLFAELVNTVDPATGTLVLNSNGSFVYTPAMNFTGTATFTYKAKDGTASSPATTVIIFVAAVNDAPVAVNDIYSTLEDDTITLAETDTNRVVKNDIDVDGNDLTVSLVSTIRPAAGTLTLNSDGTFIYKPTLDFTDSCSFYYAISDGVLSDTAKVIIYVGVVNDPPVAVRENYIVNEDNVLTVAAPGVRVNDSDPDGNSFFATMTPNFTAAKGAFAWLANGSFVFTPAPNTWGKVTFSYFVNDSQLNSNTVIDTIDVKSINDAPVAFNDAYTVNEHGTLNVPYPGVGGVLNNDKDNDADVLSAVKVSNPKNGTLTLYASGAFAYAPTGHFFGADTFTYRAKDLTDSSAIATVVITVVSVNDAPVACDTTYTINEDDSLVVAAPGVLKLVSDVDGDGLSVAQYSTASSGAVTGQTDGSFIYKPLPNSSATATFTYIATDTKLPSNTATITVIVSAVNDKPIVAQNITYNATEDVPLKVPAAGVPGLLNYVTDVDNATVTVKVVTSVTAAQGVLDVQPNGSFTYTPASNYNGTATFTFRAYDDTDSSAVATATIIVAPVNDAPVVANIPDQTVAKGVVFAPISLDTYVSDVDNTKAALTWSATTDPAVTVTINATTHMATVAVKDSLWDGSATITFTATDPGAQAGSDGAIFTVTKLAKLPLPVTDTIPGVKIASRLSMNLRVAGYAGATIFYSATTNGSQPADPKTTPAGSLSGSGLINFGPFLTETTTVKITAYSSQYPYEKGDNATFSYQIIFPKLPAVTGTPAPGQYDTTRLSVELAVPGHSDAAIYYTIDESNPAASPTRTLYVAGTPVALGPYLTAATTIIRAYATKTGYQASASTLTYSFNPQKLQKPIADPPGKTFYTDSISVTLTVPGAPIAEIRYTTDGSAPTLTSTLYNDTLTFGENTTLKAIAVKDGLIPGPVMTEIYLKSVPDSMQLFPHVDSLKSYPASIVWPAGKPLPITARIFDQFGTRLRTYDASDAPVQWKVNEKTGTNSGTLAATKGNSTTYMPIKAYQTVEIVATFTEKGVTFGASLTVIIEPGTVYRLWLEADYERRVSPNTPMPIDTVRLSSTKQKDTLYAIVRDSLGNYITASPTTVWAPSSGEIATAVSGRENIGEGLIAKQTSAGVVIAGATNSGLNLKYPSDSVVVKVMAYWYDALKIVVKDSIVFPVESVVINTNQDTSIQVFGHRDDGLGAGWERVAAKWELLDPQLEYIIAAAPGSAHVYKLSPTDTARGRIRVSLGNPAITTPDTVSVEFTPGPPTRVAMEVVTRADSIIAGEPFNVTVKIYNADNKLVYGDWRYKGGNPDSAALYSDQLTNGGRPQPTIEVDDSVLALNTRETNALVYAAQTFHNGIDTVRYVLYYAPFAPDSLHTLKVSLGPVISTSVNVRLLPGKLDSLVIATLDGVAQDTITLVAPDEDIVITAIGFDRWGNKLGQQKSDWTATDSLHDISQADNVKQIYYSAANVIYDERGYIIATATDTSNGLVVDSVQVDIWGPRARITNAVTRDLDGNGYLDAIEIKFNKMVDLPKELDSPGLEKHFVIAYTSPTGVVTAFTVEKALNSDGTTTGNDSVYIIKFAENRKGEQPQTNWTLSLDLLDAGTSVATVSDAPVADGAGPVIWSVTKIANSAGDRTKDRVIVVLSEEIVNGNGEPFEHTNRPEDVFKVWSYASADSSRLVLDSTLFKDITAFKSVIGDTLVFYMTNGKELTGSNFLSISTNRNYIDDIHKNPVSDENQEVRVVVKGAIGIVDVGPNPIMPTMQHFEDELTVHEVKDIVPWVSTGGGIFTTEIVLSSDESINVTGMMMIFDNVGNLTYTRKNDRDMIPAAWRNDEWVSGETRHFAFYWNGITDKGAKAAPGVYRVVVFLKYGNQTTKYTGELGITR
jgi:fibro-slime domain-containing protein